MGGLQERERGRNSLSQRGRERERGSKAGCLPSVFVPSAWNGEGSWAPRERGRERGRGRERERGREVPRPTLSLRDRERMFVPIAWDEEGAWR
jgi:hypothetical protein